MSDIIERVQRNIDLGQSNDHLIEELLSEALSLEDDVLELERNQFDSELDDEMDSETWVDYAYNALQDLSKRMSKKKIKTIKNFLEKASE